MFSAVLATLVLAGVLEHPWLWVLSLVVMVSVRVLRSGVVASDSLDRWKRLVNRVPAAVRLGLLWLLARLVTDALSNGAIGSYTGVALFVLGGVVTVFAVFPGSPAGPAERDDEAVPAVPAHPAGPGSSAEPAESPSGAP